MEISRPWEAYSRPVEPEIVHLLPDTMYCVTFTRFRNKLLSAAKTNQFTVLLPISIKFNCIHLMRHLLLYITILLGKLRNVYTYIHTHKHTYVYENPTPFIINFLLTRPPLITQKVPVPLGNRLMHTAVTVNTTGCNRDCESKQAFTTVQRTERHLTNTLYSTGQR